MYARHNAKIMMNNSISDWRVVVGEGAEAVLSNSVLPTLCWEPANSIFALEVTIIDSYIEHLMELRFPQEISEQVDLVGLKPGKIECLDLESGNSFLRVKNTWLGLGWSISLPAYYEEQSKNRIVIRDSYLYQLWLAFPSNSKVKISNLKPGLFSSWSLHENAQLNNVTYNVTLVNTRVEIWKLSFYGEGEIENVKVFTLDTSSNENTVILVSNSNIGQYHNRGAKYAKFSNTTITERMRFVSWEGGAGVPGRLHRGKSTIEFENSIINAPYIEIANHDAFITGTISILTPLDGVLWHSGTIIREYLLVVRDGQGSPLPDIPLRLIDWKGTIIWNGSTNQWGKALFNITFTEENYTKEWKLTAKLSGMNISKEIGFLTSTPIVLTLHKLTSSISLFASKESVKKGEQITISGSINPPLAGVAITLSFKKPDGSVFNESVLVSTNGSFAYTLIPMDLGKWSVYASWLGNENYEGASSSSILFTVEEVLMLRPLIAVTVIIVITVGYLAVRARRKPKT